MSINHVAITGNLTRDPELRSTAGCTAVMSFGIAVNDYRKNQQTGEWEDYPNFIDCTMFGARAQSVSRFLSKGSKVAIEGKLRWSQWERDGQKRSKIEVIVDEIEFMSRQQGQLGSEPVYAAAAPAQAAQPMQQQFGGMPAPQQAAPSIYNEDLPF
ncbi:single-stranded DNA-binding protein [uncultured Senegalimassilia sp.]|uniref:single-stranded DNA-binding protein n=1 Tax=uncultured Senegalimassilia sp. TaxID=1714350 RepID=UPI0026348212|nr:single-stranded DNA-binding protein [uncultured Senegalimassilia sp.]